MKNFVLLFCLILGAGMSAQDWQTDFFKAQDKAKKENKAILLVFSGSDWCAPCIKLDKNIWQSNEFKSFAKTDLVLYRADFPRKKVNKLSDEIISQNKALAENYNPKGYFPLVVMLDQETKVLGQTGYKKISSVEYIALLKTML